MILSDTINKPKTEPQKDVPKTEVKKPRPKRKKNKFSFIEQLRNDERIPKAFGLIFLLSAVFLFIAFCSYVFTWQADQDKVIHFTWSDFLNGKFTAKNALGRLGAYVSHFFIYNGFGIASFLIPVFLFAWGFNLLFRTKIFPAVSIFTSTLFLLLFIPASLAFIAANASFSFGGAVGAYEINYLQDFIGRSGTAALLFFTALLYLVIVYNINFRLPKKSSLKGSRESMIPVIEQRNATAEPVEKNDVSTPIIFSVNEKVESENESEGAEAEKDKKDEIQLQVEEPPQEIVEEKKPMLQENYDPTIDLPGYEYPSLDLLENYGVEKLRIDNEELIRNKDQIVATLRNYGIEIQSIKATVGPTVTLYEIVPSPGIRISKIKNLEDDIALSLSALGIRIIAPIPGKGTIGIEVPNLHKETVGMRTLLASEKFQNASMELPIALGKTISNEIYIADLARMPHLLMAGATGQGKSVGINEILVSLLYKKHPSQIKFVLIDPKKVELSLYQIIEKHFLAKLPGEDESIIVDTKKVINTLKSLTIEMDIRYDLLKDAQCRNMREYNEKFLNRKLSPIKGHRFLPFIVLVIDEFADLIMTAGKEIELPLARLAQLARAVGIHLIIATQRPSVNIITGTIKANFPVRMAFKVTSKVDSRTILDLGGAEQLIGRGDMLLAINGDVIRLQCGFVDTPEVERVCEFIASQPGYSGAHLLPEVQDDEDERGENFDPSEHDELFDDAAHIIVANQQGSTSLLQRRLKLGYNRAGRLMDQLEAAKIVGPNLGSKARDVLIKDEMELEQYLTDLREKSSV